MNKFYLGIAVGTALGCGVGTIGVALLRERLHRASKFVAGVVAGIVLGGAVSAAVAGPILLHWYGKYEKGKIYGLFEALDALERDFGSYDGTSAFARVYNVKCADVVAVEINGVKTVRTVRPVHGAACGHP